MHTRPLMAELCKYGRPASPAHSLASCFGPAPLQRCLPLLPKGGIPSSARLLSHNGTSTTCTSAHHLAKPKSRTRNTRASILRPRFPRRTTKPWMRRRGHLARKRCARKPLGLLPPRCPSARGSRPLPPAPPRLHPSLARPVLLLPWGPAPTAPAMPALAPRGPAAPRPRDWAHEAPAPLSFPVLDCSHAPPPAQPRAGVNDNSVAEARYAPPSTWRAMSAGARVLPAVHLPGTRTAASRWPASRVHVAPASLAPCPPAGPPLLSALCS